MKRSFTFLIPTLIIFFSLFPIGQAKAATPDYSEDYWTLEEITTLREEIQQEILNFCYFSEEPDCAERYHAEEFFSRGTDYQAADSIDAFRLLITAVNPTQNSVRTFFVDEDMANYYITGELINDNIDELYLFWFDLGFMGGYDFYNQYQSDALPSKTHLLFAKDNLADSFPPREEVTYELEGDVSEDYRNMIYYFFITANGNRYFDPIDYTSCVNHPFYREGMECRLFFSKDNGSFVYLPVEITTDTNDHTPATPEPEPESEPESEPIEESTETSNPELTPLAPNTGMKTDELTNFPAKCERRIEFPWWIILLIAAGEILTIWCLLPNFQKFPKNRQKKS